MKVVVPARFGSSRLPGKPLVDLNGLPMVVRVAHRVAAALPTAELVVATDDARVADVLSSNNIDFAMTSADHPSGTDRVEEVARLRGWGDDQIILNVQGDEPLVPKVLLESFARFCDRRADLQMATIACPIASRSQLHDAGIVKLVQSKVNRAIYFSRHAVPFYRDVPAEDLPVSQYLRHVGIYAYRRGVLRKLTNEPECAIESAEKLEQLRALWLSVPIDVFPWTSAPPHGVDTPEDVERVIRLLAAGEPA